MFVLIITSDSTDPIVYGTFKDEKEAQRYLKNVVYRKISQTV